jgi:hypothetical protein
MRGDTMVDVSYSKGSWMADGNVSFGATAAATMADTIAQAATRSLINGTNFGDNVIASLPSALGNLAGRALAGGVKTAFDGKSGGTSSSERARSAARNGSGGTIDTNSFAATGTGNTGTMGQTMGQKMADIMVRIGSDAQVTKSAGQTRRGDEGLTLKTGRRMSDVRARAQVIFGEETTDAVAPQPSLSGSFYSGKSDPNAPIMNYFGLYPDNPAAALETLASTWYFENAKVDGIRKILADDQGIPLLKPGGRDIIIDDIKSHSPDWESFMKSRDMIAAGIPGVSTEYFRQAGLDIVSAMDGRFLTAFTPSSNSIFASTFSMSGQDRNSSAPGSMLYKNWDGNRAAPSLMDLVSVRPKLPREQWAVTKWWGTEVPGTRRYYPSEMEMARPEYAWGTNDIGYLSNERMTKGELLMGGMEILAVIPITRGTKLIKVGDELSNISKLSKVGGAAAKGTVPEIIQLSKARFGHTFTRHGEDATEFLTNRAAGSGIPQGQFLDNQAAARFIQDNLARTRNGAVSLPVPEGFPARVIMPDGSFAAPSTIRLVPSGKGVKSAYPEL